MICNNCGKQVADGMKFCPECGNPVGAPTPETIDMGVENTLEFNQDPTYQNVIKADQSEGIKRRGGIVRGHNIAHIGILFASILTMIAVFLPNKAIWNAESIALKLNRMGTDSFAMIFILIALLAFTIIMSVFYKKILAIVGSFASLCWIIFTFKKCGESVLTGRGFLLFLIGGIILVISAVGSYMIERNR